ncbi:MAG: hypothetical protein HOD63_15945 [Bacteroidetes bacterium]|nr:hypothetical protein [Bacteroidota bacterium]
MLKLLSQILLNSLLFTSVLNLNAQSRQTNWENENLNGEVKSIIEYKYNSVDSLWQITSGHCFFKQLIAFNKNGTEVEKVYYSSIDEIYSKYSSIYFEGKLIKHYGFNSEGNFLIEYIYDSFANLVKEIEHQYFGMEYCEKYRKKTFCWNTHVTNFQYDNNNLVLSNSQALQYNCTSKTIYKYDESGLLINEFNYSNSVYSSFFTYYYNDLGDLIEKEYSSSDGKTLYRYLFDSTGNKIREEHFTFDGHLRQTIDYSYDQRGNCTKRNSMSLEGNIQNELNYTYEFDDKRNWIILYGMIKNRPALLVKRTIEYY